MGIVNNKGLTLIELLIVMVIISFLGIGIYVTFFSSLKSADRSQILALLQEDARSLSMIMIRDLRLAGSFPKGIVDSTCNPDGIVKAESSEIEINMDLDGDGKCDGPGEDVTYRFDNITGKLCRKNSQDDTCISLVGGLSEAEIGSKMTEFSINYLDKNGDPASNINEISMLNINFTLESNDKSIFSEKKISYSLNFTVIIRNKVLGHEIL